MTDTSATRTPLPRRTPGQPGRRLRGCCCSGCALAGIACLLFGYLALVPPRPPARPSPAEAARLDAAIASRRSEVQKLSKAAAGHTGQPFSLTLREEEINRLLETDTRVRDAMKRENVERAWVQIRDGRISATAIRRGTPPSLTVTIVPGVDSRHRLQFTVLGMGVGRLGLPSLGGLQRAAQKAVSRLLAESSLPDARFDSVEIADGALRVSGTTP